MTLRIILVLLVFSSPLTAQSEEAISMKAPVPTDEFYAVLHEMVGDNPFVIPADVVGTVVERFGISQEEFLRLLIPIASSYARPPISNYKVGIAALGKSGAVYLGCNLEFPGMPLNECVHGEQFAICHAKQHGETGIVAIALSAAPCGHCRQFLNEMGNSDLRILIPDISTQVSHILPYAFGPADLGVKGHLLTPRSSSSYEAYDLDPVEQEARIAMENSYAPYSGAKSGVAIRTLDGAIYSGSYQENAAFNPSLGPLQSALIALVAANRSYDEIESVVLMESHPEIVSHKVGARALVKKIAPRAVFRAGSTTK